MPKGKWKKQVFTNDPNLNIFFIPTDLRKQPEWLRNFSILLRLILEHITTTVNYNHIYATIPKTPLPLHKDGQEYDISYLAQDGTICLIKFKIIIPKSSSDIIVGGRARPLSHPPNSPPLSHTRGGEVSPPSATRATPPPKTEYTRMNGGGNSHG
jgi:hypothetical protein